MLEQGNIMKLYYMVVEEEKDTDYAHTRMFVVSDNDTDAVKTAEQEFTKEHPGFTSPQVYVIRTYNTEDIVEGFVSIISNTNGIR